MQSLDSYYECKDVHSSENLQEQSDLCDNNVLFSIAKFILRNVGDSGVGKVTSDMLLEVLGVRIGVEIRTTRPCPSTLPDAFTPSTFFDPK